MIKYIPNQNEEKMLREMQDMDSNNPMLWFIESNNLKSCAELIYQAGEKENNVIKYPVYYMLIGLAFENLLKGIYALTTKISNNGEMVKWPKNGHSLVELFDSANCKLNEDEKVFLTEGDKVLLDKLMKYINILGRYPVAKTFKSNIPDETIPGVFTSLSKYNDPKKDKKNIEDLYQKFFNIMKIRFGIK